MVVRLKFKTPVKPKPGSPNRRLSHYTTLGGLVGIIESGCLWASNVSFLNDSRELQHGIEASLDAIERFLQERSTEKWHEPLKHAGRALKDGKVPNTYATCFCESPDLLSQWRGYGGLEQGVSIQFDRRKLETAFQSQGTQLRPVIYGTLTASSKMKKAIREQLSALEEDRDFIEASSVRELNDAAYKVLSQLIPQFKHNGFRDERESRLIVQHRTLRDGVSFRANKNVLVPYLKLGPLGESELPIVGLMIGPGKDQVLTRRSVEMFLHKHGYASCKITLSQVPFRS
ncbi:MAG: DUF2971 domain-containing protein [Caulobacteraceae bacterium]